jgi:hypothetical protein
MKKQFLIILFLLVAIQLSYSQENRIKFETKKDNIDMTTFMTMVGFDYNKFTFKTDKSAYVNVYIDEYLNDELVSEFDYISTINKSITKLPYNIYFTKLDTSEFTLRIYSYSKSDTIEEIQFRIGEVALCRDLHVNKKDFSYSWKLAGFNNNIGPKIKNGNKIPLLYYTTALQENVNGSSVEAFCTVPNILDNRDLIENKGKIKHYFIIGMELVEKIE